MSCPEYDAYLAAPRAFKSAFQRDHEAASIAARETAAAARAQQRLERLLADRRALMEARQSEYHGAREELERRAAEAREEARARAERARADEGRFREGLAREAREREAAAAEVERRRMEDLRSERTATATTKACPSCRIRIEKNEGCMHMACKLLSLRLRDARAVVLC